MTENLTPFFFFLPMCGISEMLNFPWKFRYNNVFLSEHHYIYFDFSSHKKLLFSFMLKSKTTTPNPPKKPSIVID